MGKTTTLGLSAFLALLPVAANADSAAGNGDGVTFYGYMAYSDAWNDGSTPDPQAGFYSFTAGDGDFKAESQTGGNSSFVSCTYAGDRVSRVDVGGYYSSYTVTYSTVSADTWKQLASTSLGKNYVEGVAADMTYDYISSTLYAVTYEKHSNSNSGYLCTVDKESGVFTRLASIPFMRCVAADAAGALWSIGGDGTLYKLGKDGTVTKVGETGYVPSDLNQSATFDLRTGKLYWALDGFASDDTYHLSLVDALMSVDTATGKAEVVRRFAITFHRDKRSKRQTASALDDIEGVGPKTKELLLRHFKSVKRVLEASLPELQQLLGAARGEKLHHALHNAAERA